MGTRHTVRVIMDGKEVLNQYGQWDGNAETAGIYLYECLNKYLQKDNLVTLRNALKNVVEAEYSDDIPFALKEATWGYRHEFSEMEDFLMSYEEKHGYDVSIERTADVLSSHFGLERSASYLLLTRDTGYRILDLITHLHELNPEMKLPVVKEDGRCYWDYEIDLDKNSYTLKIGEQSISFKLDKLPDEAYMEDVCKALDEDRLDEMLNRNKEKAESRSYGTDKELKKDKNKGEER